MKLLKFTPNGKSGHRMTHDSNTTGYGFSVEIWTDEKEAVRSKRCYSWCMDIYKDDNGEYIDFSKTTLKSILGKMYLHDIAEVAV